MAHLPDYLYRFFDADNQTKTDQINDLLDAGNDYLSMLSVGSVADLVHLSGSEVLTGLKQINAFLLNDAGTLVDVRAHGAIGNGTLDCSAAVLAAVTRCSAAGGGVVFFPSFGRFRMCSNVDVPANVNVVSFGAYIYPDVPDATTAATPIFTTAVDNTRFEGLRFSGAGRAGTLTGTRYCIKVAGSSGTHIKNVRVSKCQFTDLETGYRGGTRFANGEIVTHAVFFQYADDCSMDFCTVDTISGSAVFNTSTTNANVRWNNIKDTAWYSIQFEHDNYDWSIIGNRVSGESTYCRYWGGSINIMGQHSPSAPPDARGIITLNKISGVHSYGAAVMLQSSLHVDVSYNQFNVISTAYTFPGGVPTATTGDNNVISVSMRQASGSNNGAPIDIDIEHNRFIARGVDQHALYAQNGSTASAGASIAEAARLNFSWNRLRSIDASNYFNGLYVHGQDGGWNNINIEHNDIEARANASRSPIAGIIGIAANSGKVVTGVRIRFNNIKWFAAAGAVVNTNDSAVYLDPGGTDSVADVEVRFNTFDGVYDGVYSNTTDADQRGYAQNHCINLSGQPFRFARSGSVKDSLVQTSAATTPGTVTDKYALYDAEGTLVGYVPIYDAIT